MKKLIVLAAMLLVSTAALADITLTAHNFSAQAWSDNEICKPCHTPHNSVATAPPLWAHSDTAATYTMYPQANLGNTIAAAPGAESAACLACHDDTVTLSAFVGNDSATAGTISVLYPASGAILDTDLTNDHPIGVEMTNLLASGGLTLPTAGAVTFGANNNVECASCHNPHDSTLGAPLLRMSNAASALCIDCHSI